MLYSRTYEEQRTSHVHILFPDFVVDERRMPRHTKPSDRTWANSHQTYQITYTLRTALRVFTHTHTCLSSRAHGKRSVCSLGWTTHAVDLFFVFSLRVLAIVIPRVSSRRQYVDSKEYKDHQRVKWTTAGHLATFFLSISLCSVRIKALFVPYAWKKVIFNSCKPTCYLNYTRDSLWIQLWEIAVVIRRNQEVGYWECGMHSPT